MTTRMLLHRVLRWGGLFIAASVIHGPAAAQAGTYPAKPVRLVVAFNAGGITDTIARTIGQKLQERLGQPVVIENQGGGGGTIATRQVATAPADGYTLLVNTTSMAINVSLHKNAGYDPLKDFAPIALAASTPNLFAVHPSQKAATLAELGQAFKGKRLTYATAGIGSSSHLVAEYLLKHLMGLDATHIPHRGGAPAIQSVLGAQVDLVSVSLPPAVPHVKAGTLKGLGVASLKRVEALPAVPTVAEAGFADFEDRSWVGFFAPAKTPPAIVQRLNGAIDDVLRDAATRERLAAAGFEPHAGTPAQFSAYLKAEVGKWARIVKETGVTAE